MADRTDRYDEFVFQEVNLSDNAADQPLDLSGSYLYEAEIKTSADSDITLVFKSALGGTICTKTSIDPTSYLRVSLADDATGNFAACVGKPTFTLTGLGSGTFQMLVIGTRSPQ